MLDLNQALAIVSELQAADRFNTSIGPERIGEMETLILSGDLDLDDYRNAFKDNMDRNTTLDEAQLLVVVGMSEDVLSPEECAAAMLVAEHKPFTVGSDSQEKEPAPLVTDQQREAVNISAAGRRGEAMEAARKAALDADLQAMFRNGNDSRETLKRNPCAIMVRLVQDHGGNPWSPKVECEFDNFPTPRMPLKLENGEKSNNPDEYKMYVTNSKKKVVEKSFWWWDTYADEMPEARLAITAMEGLDMADNDPSKAPPDYVKMGELRRKTEHNTQAARRSYIRTAVKTAKKLRDHMRRMAVQFPSVVVGLWSETVDGKLVLQRTIQPLRITNAADQYVTQSFSVTEFLALDLDKAQEKGGTYEAVITSGKREKVDPVPGEGSGDAAVTIQNVETVTAHYATFFDKRDNVTLLHKRLRAKAEDSDAMLTSLAQVHSELIALFQLPDLRKRASAMGYHWDAVKAPVTAPVTKVG